LCRWEGITGSLFFLYPQMFAHKIQVVLQRQRAGRRRPGGVGDRMLNGQHGGAGPPDLQGTNGSLGGGVTV
jgi:hypothetical protein